MAEGDNPMKVAIHTDGGCDGKLRMCLTPHVDRVGDDHQVIVASDFQPEPGFRFFGLLVRRHLTFHFHTA